MDTRMRGLAPTSDDSFLTRRAWVRCLLAPRRVAVGSLALLPLLALGAGTALGSGSSGGTNNSTGVSHATDSSHPHSDSSAGSGKGDASKGSDKGGDKGTSGPHGTTLSVVSNNKTNHVWVVSTDNKTGGMSVVGSAVVNHTNPGSNTHSDGSSKDTHTSTPSNQGAGSSGGGATPPKPLTVSYDKDSHTVSVIDSTNHVVVNIPDQGLGQTFGAPNTPPSNTNWHPQMPSGGAGPQNGTTTHVP